MDTSKISLDPFAVTWRLALVAALFVATNIAMQGYRLFAHQEHVPGLAMMSLDKENNLPALFAIMLLFGAFLVLALITVLEGKRNAPDVRKWAILAGGFLLMTMDEAVSLHEKAIAPLRALLGGQQLGIFYFAWVIPGIALVVALGVYFLPFMLRLPRRTAVAFAVSAAIYLGGALGVELVEGWWREQHGHRNLVYHSLVTLEEGMEMLGVIAFLHALLDYLATQFGEVRFRFGNQAAIAEQAATSEAMTLLQAQTTLVTPSAK